VSSPNSSRSASTKTDTKTGEKTDKEGRQEGRPHDRAAMWHGTPVGSHTLWEVPRTAHTPPGAAYRSVSTAATPGSHNW
jgi:hypothetical protein